MIVASRACPGKSPVTIRAMAFRNDPHTPGPPRVSRRDGETSSSGIGDG